MGCPGLATAWPWLAGCVAAAWCGAGLVPVVHGAEAGCTVEKGPLSLVTWAVDDSKQTVKPVLNMKAVESLAEIKGDIAVVSIIGSVNPTKKAQHPDSRCVLLPALRCWQQNIYKSVLGVQSHVSNPA